MRIVVQIKEKWWQSILSDFFSVVVLLTLVFASAYFDQRGFESAFIFLGMVFIFFGKNDRVKTAETREELQKIVDDVNFK